MNVFDDEENKNISMLIRWNIYILYWIVIVLLCCLFCEVCDKSNIWIISWVGYLLDGLIEKFGVFFF